MNADIELTVPNLAKLGVKRIIPPPDADILTIWDLPYPVLTNYCQLMKELGISPYAGGNLYSQGVSHALGYITSGYRDKGQGPHLFGIAIDIVCHPIEEQIRWAWKAVNNNLFTRIGLYPHHNIIHLDLASQAWMKKNKGRRYWVCRKITNPDDETKVIRRYKSFDQLTGAADFAKAINPF